MGGILDKLRRALQRERTGRRFQDRFEAGREWRKDARWTRRARRVLRLLAALVAIVVGLFLTVLPGPAILFFLLAGGLLAAESLFVARFLDWCEVRLRSGWDWVQPRWQRLSWPAKSALLGLVAGLGAGLAYVAYAQFMR